MHVLNALQKHDFIELESIDWLIGVDEAGRGCLAGPVVAGACLLGRNFFDSPEAVELSAAINDSKQLSEPLRAQQFERIVDMRAQGLLDFETAFGTVEEIEELNILGATRLAMERALSKLALRADGWTLPSSVVSGPLFEPVNTVRILVDGRPLKPFPYTHSGLVKGDGKSLSIAMASIAAKVVRDREMKRLNEHYPEYGFGQHKGYGTAHHRAALRKHGALTIHRKLFLRKVLVENVERRTLNIEH